VEGAKRAELNFKWGGLGFKGKERWARDKLKAVFSGTRGG